MKRRVVIFGLMVAMAFSAMAQKEIRVLYVGDAGVVLGPNIIASQFYTETKGYSLNIWCQPVLDALNATEDIQCDHMTTWDATESFPETVEDLSSKYDVVVLSDIEQEALVLYDWDRMLQDPMGPNRLEVIREFVRQGGGLIMIGGWQSFTGRRGVGNWGDTPVEEALPVTCLDVNDDRREAPQGVHIRTLVNDHPVVAGFDWDNGPRFSGYNRFKAKPDATVIADVREFGDPFIVAGTFGEGRCMAFASDVSPHWGTGFQKWDRYGDFFCSIMRWLAKAK